MASQASGGMRSKVRPDEINTEVHLWEAFGQMETEDAAAWVVRLCIKLGGWGPFTGKQMEDFYRAAGFRGFVSAGLFDNKNWIVATRSDHEATYEVTDEFVGRCFMSSEKHGRKRAAAR